MPPFSSSIPFLFGITDIINVSPAIKDFGLTDISVGDEDKERVNSPVEESFTKFPNASPVIKTTRHIVATRGLLIPFCPSLILVGFKNLNSFLLEERIEKSTKQCPWVAT